LPAIGQLTGVYTDSGLDSDANGLFDQLKLTVGVQVIESTIYHVVARLKKMGSAEIASANILITKVVHFLDP